MSYISDYKCGAIDYDEYCQYAAEENRKDEAERDWYYGKEEEE